MFSFSKIIDIANADEDTIFRIDLWRKFVDVAEFGGSEPHERSEGIPWTLPLGEESGVFISVCASIQSNPIF